MNQFVWIIDDDNSIRWVLEKALARTDIQCESFASADLMLQRLEYEQPAVVVSDIRMPGTDGMALLSKLQELSPDLPVIIMTAHSDLDSAVNAFKRGAFEYLPKPFDVNDAVALISRALEHSKNQLAKQQPLPPALNPEIIGEAPAMQEVFRAIGRLARSSISVLINGQSGTGKELVARALHKHSPRSEKPFIALNMAAIPKDLIESELFGHEKGAFTGANTQRKGRFEQADSGTLFLDEIGDMPLDVQTRLLRVLADGQFYRVGGHQAVGVDVRIIAATHQNLELLAQEGKFREDLFHRLNVIRVHLPTLKERRQDIAKLARHFLQQAATELNVEAKTLSKEAELFLTDLDWPGNVRQLENTCRWLTVMASGKHIVVADMPPELTQSGKNSYNSVTDAVHGDWQSLLAQWVTERLAAGEENILAEAGPAFEKIVLQQALHHTHGHKQEAARKLGWGRNTLTRKLKELGVE
ncbi:nitrogen regulation protein NR(I) [Alishewanella sp. 16-MA]|uniref:DNA-binding transcriptional regulator NtrC n=1 Tax=Alishewanella maricola TaxID=2795740 RepID=A0ABS8BZ51_9ALTE|nr:MULTISPECIES: nitrogen regulation protein NR(I) [Gammaproteobacteria]MDP4944448.1 nitrogen regulation protein NR(I) [Alishewanella sp.]MCB5225346.1 nitrogen regulation protein NR(I) [Alishewanella maricola]MCC5453324.1 nitrogen regulation protein NR(I) [Rheinheimera sp. UJ51]MDP5036870.1 nitrogen regulation protein NR(I) [Alishewanella sp.]MDP5187256.1 nitrogen regulation protein NR(I) [Alishewanella sp.]